MSAAALSPLGARGQGAISWAVFGGKWVVLAVGLCGIGQGTVAEAQGNRSGTWTRRPGAATIDELDRAEQAHLVRADALIQGDQVDEAVETLRRIMDAHGEQLVPLQSASEHQPAGFRRYVTAREYCTAQLARLAHGAPEAFAAYRRQIDPLAASWLAEAEASGDEAALERIVRHAFLSRAGDEALLRLGDRALERGDYNRARRCWESIHPGLRFPDNEREVAARAARRPLWLPLRGVDMDTVWPVLGPLLSGSTATEELIYPDAGVDRAAVRARLTWLSMLEGNLERARIELEILRREAAGAVGSLGGREGRWTELLETQLAAITPPPRAAGDWLTLGGSATRQRVAAVAGDAAELPLWSLPLPRINAGRELLSLNRLRVAESANAILAYHPVVAGDQVVVQTGVRREDVVACGLRTGERLFPVPGAAPVRDAAGAAWGRNVLGVPRYTTTVWGDRLFVRTGIPLCPAPGSQERLAMPTRLEALDLSAEGKLLWSVGPEAPPWGNEWTFGGAPVTDGRQLYISGFRRGALRVELHVAALDLLDGRIRWRRLVAAAEPPFDDNTSFLAHHLLTVDQGVIYCNSNLGVVAALDARSGAPLWTTVYPRVGLGGLDPDRNELHFYRDLNPCLLYRDLVVIAPTDSDRLFVLDATTGITLWSTPAEVAADAIHLLGVAGDYLLVSGECLYWFDAYNGQLAAQFPGPFNPAPGFARPSPRGYGRGVLAGDCVYWSTRDAILVFETQLARAERGGEPVVVRELPLLSGGGTGGNLAVAKGVLLVAGEDRLVAFDISGNKDHGTR